MTEELIALSDVPGHLPRRRGKKVHYSTVYRWTTKGVRGAKLDSRLIGGVRYTTADALRHFYATTQSATHRHELDAALREHLYGEGRNA